MKLFDHSFNLEMTEGNELIVSNCNFNGISAIVFSGSLVCQNELNVNDDTTLMNKGKIFANKLIINGKKFDSVFGEYHFFEIHFIPENTENKEIRLSNAIIESEFCNLKDIKLHYIQRMDSHVKR